MTSSPTWIQPIEPQLKELLDIPDFSFSSTFPFDSIASFISSTLGISEFSLELGTKEWKSKETFFTGLGSSPISISFQATPLNGDCFWVMAYEDIQTFISWMKDQNKKALELENPELIKGVYRFAMLVALEALSETELFKQFSLKLTKDTKHEEKGYAIDVALVNGDKRIWGRLILSPKFKESFMNFFSKERTSIADLTKQFPHLKIPLSITNGSIELSQDELKSLEEGDFIVVENAHYKPSDEKGSLKILLNETPLFQVKLKEGKFKILDYIYAYDEETANAR